MIGEWIRFGLCAAFLLAGLFIMVVSIIGLFRFDIVAWIFGGQGAVISRIVYILVALSAAWCISLLFRDNSAPEHAG